MNQKRRHYLTPGSDCYPIMNLWKTFQERRVSLRTPRLSVALLVGRRKVVPDAQRREDPRSPRETGALGTFTVKRSGEVLC